MLSHLKKPDSKSLLRFRTVTGQDFWEKKIADSDDLKTRQAEYSKSVPTDPRVIFYESMSGARMMDSPYALFLRLYHDPAYQGFHHVWSVRSSALVPKDFKDDPRTTFVTRGTDAHLYFLAKAGYIIGNSLLPDHFVRKKDQKYLNTWHGIAYKALGRNESSPLGAAGSVYNLLQATHVLTPCPFMSETELTRFSLRGVFAGSMAEIGYPRQDLTVNATAAKKSGLAQELGLDPAKKTVIYAPTWRGNKGTARFDAQQLESDIDWLMTLDANVIFQAHHIMLRHIKHVEYGNIIVPPASIVTNELLTVADLLITDYSSIFFDFLATGKPIVHYLYDYNEYSEERGLLLEMSDLPGPVVFTGSELIATVDQLLSEEYSPTSQYQQAVDRFCPHDDGNACRRTIQWFISGDDCGINLIQPRTRPSIVFWGGRLDKSKTTRDFISAANTAAQIGNKDVTLFVAHSVKSNAYAMDLIRQIDPSISIIARNDFEMIMTTEEKAARSGTNDSPQLKTPTGEESRWQRLKNSMFRRASSTKSTDELLDGMYQREYRRIFGDSQFDEVIIFKGASTFWKKLAEHALR